MGGRYFSAYFITCCHSQFCMDLNEANPFICCYDISVVTLSEYLALPNISSSVIFKCCLLQCRECHGLDFSTHLCKNLTWFLSLNLCHFKTTTLRSHWFIVQEFIIANFIKWKKSDLFANFFNSSLFLLTIWVKIGSIHSYCIIVSNAQGCDAEGKFSDF